jgi:hypothetical protein
MSNFKIPAFAEAASRRQANVKSKSNDKVLMIFSSSDFDNWTFGFHLNFELCHLSLMVSCCCSPAVKEA